MQSPPFEDFGASLKNYFNNKTLSDATIRCGGCFFSVHSLVLFCHSEYFRKQLDGPWKESLGREIHILDFDPPVVEAMIIFFYRFDYNSDDNRPDMSFHAKAYQIADKYGIEALKKLSATKFRASIDRYWDTDEFSAAVTLAYTTTPPGDRGLRDIAVEVAFKRLGKLVRRDRFCEMLRDNPDLAADIIRFTTRQYERVEEYKCTWCSRVFCMGFLEFQEPSQLKYCPSCSQSNSSWRPVADSQ